MDATTQNLSKPVLWASYILQIFVGAMMLMGAANNILQTEMAVKGAADMGYPAASTLYLGVVLLVAVILYAVPRTTVIGAILITGWLGGAIATHIIHHDTVDKIIFPVVFGIITWVAIGLRHATLKKLLING